jgi:hypothetical protein
MMEFPMGEGRTAAGFGTGGKPYLWLSDSGGRPSPTGHVALQARNGGQVDAFYQAALGAGGTDNGPPGLRPHYHAKYYAAFVRDPDGNNIEAVWHGEAEEEAAAPARRRRAPARRASAAKKPAARKAAGKKPARKAAAKKPAGRSGKTAGGLSGGGMSRGGRGRTGGGRSGRR